METYFAVPRGRFKIVFLLARIYNDLRQLSVWKFVAQSLNSFGCEKYFFCRFMRLMGGIMGSFKLGVGILVMGAVMSVGSMASADTITTNLTFWNEPVLNAAGDYVRVTLSGSTVGSYNTISFQFVNGDTVTPTGQTVDKLGWNGAIGVSSTGCPSGWTCNGTANNQAGFGSFSQFETIAPAAQGTGVTSAITFGLAQAVNGFSTLGTMIAHVRYTDGCSGFVSNIQPRGGASGTSCGSVPEPPLTLLMGMGMVAFGLWRWRAAKHSV